MRRAAPAVLACALLAGASVGSLAQNDYQLAPSQNPLTNLSKSFKFRTDPGQPPDWVVKTRKPESELHYMPTGAAARTEPAPAMTLERAREIERQLDSERARHDRLSGRKAAPKAKRSVALDPIKKTRPKSPDCVLTCQTPIGMPKKR